MSTQMIGRIALLIVGTLMGLAILACSSEPDVELPPAAAPAPAAQPAQPQAGVTAPTETPKAEVDLQAIREARAQRRLELLGLPEPEPAQVPADLEAKVDEYIAAAAERGSFSGSILIAQGDNVLMSKGYGMADYENGIPNTPQTKFNLGNITRQFTAMAIVQLQERGLLHVDDPVSKYLPDYPRGDQITLHHLLVTTAGIPSYAFGPEFAEISKTPTSVEELISLFRDKPLDFEVGTSVNWSASGYVLLGYVIEQVSGMSYEAYIQENIFDPLDMSDSGYDINRPGVTQRAYGYLNTGTSPVREASMDMSNAYAAAGLYSTAEDLYKWDRALQTEKLVSRETLDAIFTNYFESEKGFQLGYGWLLIPRTSSFLIAAGGGRDLVGT